MTELSVDLLRRTMQELRDAPPPHPLGSPEAPMILPYFWATDEGYREALDRALPQAFRIVFR